MTSRASGKLVRAILCAGLTALAVGRGIADTPVSGAKVTAASPATGRLTVKVTGIRGDRGEIRIALFRGAKGFPGSDTEALAHQSVDISPAAGGTVTATFGDLAPGEYAVALFHDENDNGILDTSLGFPLEGFGTSNNPSLHWRAPTYNEAKFALNRDCGGDATITIQMRYLTANGPD